MSSDPAKTSANGGQLFGSLVGIFAFAYFAFQFNFFGLASDQVPREEFRRAVIGKSQNGVIEAFGKPDSTQDMGQNTYWYYQYKTMDPITQKADIQAQVVFESGVAVKVNY